MSRRSLGSIVAVLVLLAHVNVGAAHPGSGTGDNGSPAELENGSDQSWFDPTLPGIPSHASAYPRRNAPRVDPLKDSGVIPVADTPFLRSLLGKWREIDPPYAARFAVGPADSGTLECTATHEGAMVETRWQRSWSTNVLPGLDVRNVLFATDQGFYLHRTSDRGRVVQLAGSRSATGVRVVHHWDYTGVGEEWIFVSPDTLKLDIWESRASGWCGTVLVEDHLFTRVKD